MALLMFALAAVVLFYWLYGVSQPFINKPEVFRGVSGGLWILGVAIAFAALAILL
ncbi:MAG: hypothetical protein Q8P50_01710 [Bacillota bacterium]|nr:hypothetical protein [Bacillota bacterium]